MRFLKSVALLLTSALLLTLLASCAKKPADPETGETTAPVSDNVTDPVESEQGSDEKESDAETLPEGDAPDKDYAVNGEYTVLSDTDFSVMVKVGDQLSQQYLRLAVIDRKGNGIATYMDVVDEEGAVLCTEILPGFAMVFVDRNTEDATRVAVFRCAFRDGENGAEVLLGLSEYELSDRLFDLAGTTTGELGFRLYNAHGNAGISTGFDPSACEQLNAPIRSLGDEVAKAVSSSFSLVLDSYERTAHTLQPNEIVSSESIREVITLDVVKEVYLRRIYDDTTVVPPETSDYDDSGDSFE